MKPPRLTGDGEEINSREVLWEDDERVFCRTLREGGDGNAILALLTRTDNPRPSSLHRFAHEYELKDDLEETWALRPMDLHC